ncbi:carboxypeptidase-like regulatory domain-containing protein [Siphonobacter sp. SORGH_AS_1065]|uniref:carboxypeptidase-like regulatory domain-containing protein n=1 Tax=Siphonobacter sp. SORGH_AS_1065 TaxID=3041795 RepID=UPI00277DC1A1|nr:carboxypeptidase-like regulatory domain-containing protein [Siphonobacter sp. SORGH_AS_1065]MDQ1088582.1 hypothetical protein [Siphonobacter sp. SORGH_AS_1065]
MKFSFTLFLFLIISANLFGQEIRGVVKDEMGDPIPGTTVKVKNKKISTVTDALGNFKIKASIGDTLEFQFIGFSPTYRVIGRQDSYEINLTSSNYKLYEVMGVAAATSTESQWVGANLFYNFDGSNLDNVVGGAKVQLSTAKNLTGAFRFYVVGNIGKFSSGVDKADLEKNIKDIVQSEQGLSVGLCPLYRIMDKPNLKIRTWSTINYKLNSFNNIEDGQGNKTSIALNQGRLTLGGEIEAIEFIDNENKMHLGIEGSYTFFDKNTYYSIFQKERKGILGLEITLVIPIFNKFGFMVNQTFMQGSKPVFGAGLIIPR